MRLHAMLAPNHDRDFLGSSRHLKWMIRKALTDCGKVLVNIRLVSSKQRAHVVMSLVVFWPLFIV